MVSISSCKWCGELVKVEHPNRRYCDNKCKYAAQNQRRKEQKAANNRGAVCDYCHTEYTKSRRDQRYCSTSCYSLAYSDANYSFNVNLGPSGRSVTGAAVELIVAADLLFQGFEVFRAVAPHCSCDLVAHKDGILLRIEVKRSTQRKDGTLIRPSCNPDKFDVLALVGSARNDVTYDPPLL